MSNSLLNVRRWEDYYANYDPKYMAEITHDGLKEHRVLTDRDEYILENKIRTLSDRWESKWDKVYEKQQKEALISDLSEKADNQDIEARSYVDDVENVLSLTLEVDDKVDWETLKDKSRFTERKPNKPSEPSRDSIPTYIRPNPNSDKYHPKFTIWEKLISSKKQNKEALFAQIFSNDLEDHEKKCERAEKYFNRRVNDFKDAVISHQNVCDEIDKRRKEFDLRKQTSNDKVDEFKISYLEHNLDAVEEYCNLVLSNSHYPSQFPQSYEIEFTSDNKSLIVDYWLPSLEDMPAVKEVKFIKSRQEIKPVAVSDAQRRKYFDSTIYQIALRTIHELFEADVANALEMITFNGFVNYISKSTGKQETSCIVSLQTSKEEFIEIDLSRVDPKECFRGLKGVGSSKLYGLTPIKPIMKMDRNDSRIASHYSVVGDIDDSVNLASMGWEDFEHLVRELFAKEFSGEGSEVHVTRASKDGGVDAIAFDADPIRGGKIVIQAKRYTNTVGVAAVRDLYGTVMNEGAIKGILVTTSNYGPDSYNFVKNKPLVLLNGSNLLHLLMKHGVEAKIDLKEAKKLK
jgi:restriction system protein